jgi:hypothetical protein
MLGISAAALLAGWAGHAAAQPADDYGTTPAESGQLELGQPQTGELEQSGDVDWFAVTLEQGRQYQIDYEGQPTGQGTLSDPRMELVGPNGGVVDGDDDGGSGFNARLRHTAEQSGTYHVAAGAFGGSTGSYTLTVQEFTPPPDDFADGTDTSGSLEVGGEVTGEIGHDGDVDMFALELTAGQSYELSMQGQPTGAGSLPDPYLQLFDADGQQIDGDDDGGTGFNSRLILTPDRDGRFYAGAAAFGGAIGTYRLSLAEYVAPPDDYTTDAEGAGSVAVGGSVTGEIEVPDDQDWFGIELEAGQRVVIDLEGSPSNAGSLRDPYLTVYGPGGGLVASNDDGGDGFNSRLLLDAPAAGRYHLEAGAFGDATGTYRLSVSDAADIADDFAGNADTAGRLAIGGSVTGELEIAGDTDWFAVPMDAGETYVFTLQGQPSGRGSLNDPYLALYDQSGAMLASNDDYDGLESRLDFTPDSSGVFFLEARGFADSIGSYTLAAQEAGAPGDIRFGEIEPEAAADGDNIAIVIELTDGERLTVLVPRDYLSEVGSVYIGPQ